MIVMNFQIGRIRDDSGSKSTRGCTRKRVLPLPFPLRAFLCGVGFEHREQWIEDRWQTVSECFAARFYGFAVMDTPVARPGEIGAGCRKRVVGRGCRPAVVGYQRIKESTDLGW